MQKCVECYQSEGVQIAWIYWQPSNGYECSRLFGNMQDHRQEPQEVDVIL